MANACSSPPLESCPLKVTDLPTDILREIFDYFKDARMARPGRVDWTWSKSYDDLTKKRQAVLSSRLVCRRLRDMASPLLLPTVRVKLERESLSRFEEISRIPEVAASVRGIEIVLSCRSGELATDLGRFITHRKEDIRIVRDVEPHFAEIEQAWDDYLKDPTVDTVGNKYQTLLRESFSEYKRRHDEQMELVESGTFVDTIASAVSRMPLFGSLLFDDADIYAGHLTPDEREAPSLSLALTAAKSWTALEAMSVELTAARVLSDLPIAIHKAGVSLRELCVFCFPTTEHIGAPLTQDIDLLRAAYQYLEEGTH
ncbi:uncharacterized protein DNG_07077 [Cephalotrichum gorgonifer]|uniref:F-box domain-containing protein n=1 Tax=Cephalotrichum gorgonifer TaxID=2041049 RepID=A0AAE8N3X7_9PEZI|nr:uncharacterized protein DNG_07077 [Cephalotrichum gorgonifer]